MSSGGARGLADHLRALDDAALMALVRARPDLAHPVPADFSVLATRAQSRLSVARALDGLNAFTLEVLDAVRLAAAPTATRHEVLDLVGGGADPSGALDLLISLAIVWGEDDALHVVPAVEEATGPYPAGLGRPVHELVAALTTDQAARILDALGLEAARQPTATALIAEFFADSDRLRSLIATAPDDSRGVLARLAAGPPIGSVQGARLPFLLSDVDSPVFWLVGHGLLVAVGDTTVELPREVGLAVRGDAPLGTLHPAPAVPVNAPRVEQSTVDGAGAGQALETVRLVNTLLEACADDPPGVLRSGGMGVRDLRRLARALAQTESTTALLLEVACAARLLADSGDLEPEWLPTPAYDLWRTDDAAGRWTALAAAWLTMPRLPGIIGSRDDRDKILAPLSAEAGRSGAPINRRAALIAIADLPPGTAPNPADVAALVAWTAPRRGGRGVHGRDTAIDWALTEAATLGVTGRGALTSFGRALLAEGATTDGDAAEVLRMHLPTPLDYVLVQPDLTVVAPGPLESELADQLRAVCDVESSGAATVYRATPDSVRRGLDAGWTAEDVHALFAKRSRTPVPQALTYLVDDTARRHGGIRLGAAGAYLRSDDETLLATVLADRRTESLSLRRLAPTVLISAATPQRLLEVLRSAGYPPVAEDASGAVVLTGPAGRRATVRVRSIRPGADLPVLDDSRLRSLLRAVRSGDDAARTARRAPVLTTHVPGVTTATTLSVLQHAVKDRALVQLGYVDAHGGTVVRVVRPVSIGGGYLRAIDDRTEILHTFALHRITSAALLTDEAPAADG